MISVLFLAEKYQKESQRLRDNFIKRNERAQAMVGGVLRNSNRDVLACSPDNYLYGKVHPIHNLINISLYSSEILFYSILCVQYRQNMKK